MLMLTGTADGTMSNFAFNSLTLNLLGQLLAATNGLRFIPFCLMIHGHLFIKSYLYHVFVFKLIQLDLN